MAIGGPDSQIHSMVDAPILRSGTFAQTNSAIKMKLSCGLILLSAASCSAFSPTVLKGRSVSVSSATALSASRNRDKIASRSKWAEARGMSDDVAVAEKVEAGLKTNSDGLEYVKLVHENGSSSEIYLFGGDVTSYIDAEGIEYIAVRPDAKMDGSKPISGGLSHCFPQFGPGEIQQQ
mmetsp:Transcript_23937/g.49444  ORF Transcript_23937/g.49444 Transcript_23937/m.49444 type:complete len:178 (-) Transcript_23937:12-545(-)